MEKQALKQRFAFIELLAYWEGRINAKELEKQFQLSRQQSSQDINRYKQNAPKNLIYDSSQKAYRPSDHFSPLYISDSADEYLHWLHTSQFYARPVPGFTEALTLPPRKIGAPILRGIVAAIRQQKRIEVGYVSLSNPDHEGRIIAPHSFVSTGLRWHLRAWCEKNMRYSDFVLSRFRGLPELLDRTTHIAEHDEGWTKSIPIILQADHRLTAAKREVVENDYQMQNGQLRIQTKACLVQYMLRELQVNTKTLDETPEAQQLVCVNLPELKRWLYEG